MERRKFLQSTGGLAALAVTPATEPSPSAGVSAGYAADQGDFPTDSYQMPDWLLYARTVYFDGYSPPVYPHPRDFDARRLMETVAELGGNLLRFQPIGSWAYYPSKAFRVHPELGRRDLIDEVAREARRVGVHFISFVTPDMATLTWNSVGLAAIPSMPTGSCAGRMEDLTERIGTSAGRIASGSARQVMPIGRDSPNRQGTM